MRKKRLIVWLSIAGVAAAAVLLAPSAAPPALEVAVSAAAPRAGAAPESRFAALPEREAIGSRRGEVFAPRSWTPPSAPAKPAAAAMQTQSAPAGPPPMPFRVAGRVVHGADASVVLARGDAVLPVRVGDTLDGGYRVEAIAADAVTLVYLPLGVRENLALASTLGPEAPTPPARAAATAGPSAQLRWEGPRQVRAGDKFDVALKVTSAQPLRASPLQLVFDAKLLEAVDVRAGGFFAGGMFSYRVNPSGSIFVGASGKGAAAADAELLVVTFRPIRPGATAELTLSSVLLQSAAGRSIALDRPTAFRTSIVQ